MAIVTGIPFSESQLISSKPHIFTSINTTHIEHLLTVKAVSLIISFPGELLELADRRDLGSRAERREGSSPSFPMIITPFSLEGVTYEGKKH